MDRGGRDFYRWLTISLAASIAAMIIVGYSRQARAEKTGSWAGSPPHVLEWLRAQKQPGSNASCCGLGDAVNVEVLGESDGVLTLVVTNGHGNLPDGTMLAVEVSRQVKTNLDEDGNDVAWVNKAGHVYCLSRAPRV